MFSLHSFHILGKGGYYKLLISFYSFTNYWFSVPCLLVLKCFGNLGTEMNFLDNPNMFIIIRLKEVSENFSTSLLLLSLHLLVSKLRCKAFNFAAINHCNVVKSVYQVCSPSLRLVVVLANRSWKWTPLNAYMENLVLARRRCITSIYFHTHYLKSS